MAYVSRSARDSIPRALSALLATGSVTLLALVWRQMTAPRSEHRARKTNAVPPEAPLPPPAAGEDTQRSQTGSGALFHRLYEVLLTDTGLTSAATLRLMHQHMTDLAPSPLARFEKSAGTVSHLRVGDEYDITMLGPWNGRVRVTESSSEHFTLATLDGHPEVGHITFRVAATNDPYDALCVQIESWARARDAVVHAAYATLGIGKQIQTEVWITFLQRLSALVGMTGTPEVRITTEALDADLLTLRESAVLTNG